MKNTKPKTALSKLFPRLNTTFEGVQNLTRSKLAKIGQYCLITASLIAGALAMYHQHVMLCIAAMVAMSLAFLLEGYRN